MMTARKIESELVEVDCTRCGGQGWSDAWANTGRTCFECGGTGVEVVTEYRAEEIRISEAQKRSNALLGKAFDVIDRRLDCASSCPTAGAEFAEELFDWNDRAAAVDFLRFLQRLDLSGAGYGPREDCVREARRLAREIVDAGNAEKSAQH